MKNFVIDFGRGLIDFSAWFWIIVIVICGVIAMFNDVVVGLAILLGGTIIFIISYYLIYLAISINDNLTEINKKLFPIHEEKEITEADMGLNGKIYKQD